MIISRHYADGFNFEKLGEYCKPDDTGNPTLCDTTRRTLIALILIGTLLVLVAIGCICNGKSRAKFRQLRERWKESKKQSGSSTSSPDNGPGDAFQIWIEYVLESVGFEDHSVILTSRV
ncbi:hypothetical protein B0T16DRAFT_455545 [Cercophora newfieldiana]|uniref:Uncharacterized protein n=1 Tax=Cercophora newfieldiana TaxID=92897 RepID=A0AA39Y978_9PEZI|nr:hypothetical protein B0T16DRAFT_455545 [Cercophora newfieldiana]